MENLPYLTAELPGIGGLIKQCPEDFRVEELPLYEACGEGTHIYFEVAKCGIPTPVAVDRIARYMGVKPTDIGFAGLKDAQAVTTQRMSLEHADPEKLAAYRDPQMRVTWTGRHINKLRPGHLAGNRFVLRIREVGEAQLSVAQQILDVLARRGVPNYFGQQRFGLRGETDLLGRALVKNDLNGFIAIYLGQSQPGDPPDCKAARDAFDAGYLDRALKCWPRHYVNERKALSAFKKKRKPGPAIAAIDKRMRRLYVSAFQSTIFNDILARRIDTLDRVFVGDMAQKEDTGGIFTVEDPSIDQPRTDAFEISPTGPILGYRGGLAEGDPGQVEREVIASHEITQDEFRHVGSLSAKGGRRALRFPLKEPHLSAGKDEQGFYLEITFSAPSGGYATAVLREIMKTEN